MPRALAAPEGAVRLPRLAWLGAAALAGLLGALGAAPVAALAVVLALAVGVGVLASPFVFLWLLTVAAGAGLGWTENAVLEVAGRALNVNALRWVLTIAACALILLRTRPHTVPAVFRPYLAFVALAALGALWAPDRGEALKAVLLYGAPLLLALVAVATLDSEAQLRALRNAVLAGAVAAVAIGLLATLLGHPLDVDGRPLHRALGIFLLPAMALALARVRTGGLRHAGAAALVLLAALPTLSRASIGIMLLLGAVTMAGASLRRQLVLAALLLVLGAGALQYGPLRERIFSDPRRGLSGVVEVTGEGSNAQLELAGVQLSGRGLVWLRTWRHAAERPIAGHGTGSATEFLARERVGGVLHPHNEYLRSFHDLGVLGLAALLAAFAGAALALRRLERASRSPLARELAWAGLLCWLAFALTALVDNTLSYFVFFTHNVFLVSALAVRAGELAVRGPAEEAA